MHKATMNQLHNATNPAQTTAKKVLCLCSAGALRSPTAANVLYREFGFNTRAAGLDQEFALVPVTEALLMWADEIVVMDLCMEQEVRQLYISLGTKIKNIVNLDIPDHYVWDDRKLVKIILGNYPMEDSAGKAGSQS